MSEWKEAVVPEHVETSTHATVEAVFAAIDSGLLDCATEYFSDDITFHFANIGPLTGSAAFIDLYSQFAGILQAVHHQIHNIWSVMESPDIVIAQATAHYTHVNGGRVSLPCCNIFRMSGQLISEYRVFMDITPALSAPTVTSAT